MSRRRRRQDGSSLDLFLDTICNTFGSILFISLLISLTAKGKKDEMEAPDSSTIDQSAFEEQKERIEQLAASIAAKKVILESLERQLPTPEDAETIKLQERVIEAEKNLDKAVQQQISDSSKLATIQSEIAKLMMDAENVEMSIKEARAALMTKNSGIAEMMNSEKAKVPIPNLSSSGKANFLVALRHGKLYLVSDPSSDNARDVYVKHMQEDNAGSVTPRSSTGWRLGNASDENQFFDAIKDLLPSDYFISIGVWPDSFKESQKLRELIVGKGYQYELLLFDGQESVPIREGKNPKVQ